MRIGLEISDFVLLKERNVSHFLKSDLGICEGGQIKRIDQSKRQSISFEEEYEFVAFF